MSESRTPSFNTQRVSAGANNSLYDIWMFSPTTLVILKALTDFNNDSLICSSEAIKWLVRILRIGWILHTECMVMSKDD